MPQGRRWLSTSTPMANDGGAGAVAMEGCGVGASRRGGDGGVKEARTGRQGQGGECVAGQRASEELCCSTVWCGVCARGCAMPMALRPARSARSVLLSECCIGGCVRVDAYLCARSAPTKIEGCRCEMCLCRKYGKSRPAEIHLKTEIRVKR